MGVLGKELGLALGNELGLALGSFVGEVEGLPLGLALGLALGRALGLDEGLTLGDSVEHRPSTNTGAPQLLEAPLQTLSPLQSKALQQPSLVSHEASQPPPPSVQVSSPSIEPL